MEDQTDRIAAQQTAASPGDAAQPNAEAPVPAGATEEPAPAHAAQEAEAPAQAVGQAENRRAAMLNAAQQARERRADSGAHAPSRNPALHPARRDPMPKRPKVRPPRPRPVPTAEADAPAPKQRREKRAHPHRDRFARRLMLIAIVLILLIVLVLLVLPRFERAVEAIAPPAVNITVPDSVAGLLPDEEMGYTAIDFTNAILGESRERKELVVMEQDVHVTSKISQDLLNLALFSKVKIIHSYGTGVYTVALSEMRTEDVTVDESTRIITVTIPHTVLSYVNVDVGKTEFEDTQRALLAVGEIKLTTEQKQKLDESVDDALHARLVDPALFVKADEIALNKVREVFSPVVSGLSADYIVKVVMQPKAG